MSNTNIHSSVKIHDGFGLFVYEYVTTKDLRELFEKSYRASDGREALNGYHYKSIEQTFDNDTAFVKFFDAVAKIASKNDIIKFFIDLAVAYSINPTKTQIFIRFDNPAWDNYQHLMEILENIVEYDDIAVYAHETLGEKLNDARASFIYDNLGLSGMEELGKRLLEDYEYIIEDDKLYVNESFS